MDSKPENLCKHLNFEAESKVFRLTDDKEETVIAYKLELTVFCKDCFMPFRFIGLPNGISPSYPTVDVEGVVVRLPIKPV